MVHHHYTGFFMSTSFVIFEQRITDEGSWETVLMTTTCECKAIDAVDGLERCEEIMFAIGEGYEMAILELRKTKSFSSMKLSERGLKAVAQYVLLVL